MSKRSNARTKSRFQISVPYKSHKRIVCIKDFCSIGEPLKTTSLVSHTDAYFRLVHEEGDKFKIAPERNEDLILQGYHHQKLDTAVFVGPEGND